MDSPPTLQYAPAPPTAARWRRRGFRLILLAGFVAILWLWGGVAWTKLNFDYWEHRCLAFSLPADQVVFQLPNSSNPLGNIPAPLSKLAAYGGPSALGPAIYLHDMRRPDGSRWLVSMQVTNSDFIDGPNAGDYSIVFSEYGIDKFASNSQWDPDGFPSIRSSQPWKIYAGQLDPVNPSHFTFDFENNAKRHTADVWLDNEGKFVVSVRLESK